MWGTLTYTPAGGSFMFILGLAGLAALPFLGPMTDLAHFDHYMSWRRAHHPRHTKWSSPAERLEAWAEVRAYRAPRFFFPSGHAA